MPARATSPAGSCSSSWGLLALFALARSRAFDRLLSRLIRGGLNRWTDLEARDYAALLHIAEDYTVMEMFVEPGDWTAHRRIAELAPWDEGVRILGIVRPNGRYVGAPIGVTEIRPGDTLVGLRAGGAARRARLPSCGLGRRRRARGGGARAARDARGGE